jgi:bifunctional enzyme CysN/CysC
MLFEDQIASLEQDSRRVGTQNGELDYALVLDGLQAEREQGITIDVAYRYFSTDRRAFVMVDCPGHEQYTRNMVTGASNADCAVVVLDARSGVLTQTRRHCALVALLGIRHVAVAVTKMDLVDYGEQPFRTAEREVLEFAGRLGLEAATCIPVSGLRGDNVIERSARMPWYAGSTLMDYLETVAPESPRPGDEPLRMWIQNVIRIDDGSGSRGLAGTVASGELAPGDPVVVLPSGRETRVARIITYDGDLELASAGHAVTVTLEDEIDASRGDLVSGIRDRAGVADQFEATVVWMTDEPLLPGRNYLMRIGTQTATATATPLKHKLGIESMSRIAARQLELNEIGVCDLELNRRIPFDPYSTCRETGAFILIDRLTLDTVGAGMLQYALRRSENVHWQAIDVDKRSRAAIKSQKPCVIWLTGLPSAGKSTIANLLERRLYSSGYHTYLLDGDNLRHGLSKDLGFTAADRVENIRRAGEIARLMVDAGLIVICSFISPFASERDTVRSLLEPGEFFEVFVDVPLSVAEERDRKGLYRKARRGDLINFTGVDSPYERPGQPEVHIDAVTLNAAESAELVIGVLSEAGIIGH